MFDEKEARTVTRRKVAQGFGAAWNLVLRYVRGARITWSIIPDLRTSMRAVNESSRGASYTLSDAVEVGRPNPAEISHETAVLTAAVTLQVRPLDAILRDGVTGSATIEQRVAYPREIVEIPPLCIGAETLAQVTIRENERHISWRETAYLSLSPAVYAIDNLLVHGGISQPTWPAARDHLAAGWPYRNIAR